MSCSCYHPCQWQCNACCRSCEECKNYYRQHAQPAPDWLSPEAVKTFLRWVEAHPNNLQLYEKDCRAAIRAFIQQQCI